jgi:hypothetical protein
MASRATIAALFMLCSVAVWAYPSPNRHASWAAVIVLGSFRIYLLDPEVRCVAL